MNEIDILKDLISTDDYNPDLKCKKILKDNKYVFIVYVDSLCSSNFINDFILRPLNTINSIDLNVLFNTLTVNNIILSEDKDKLLNFLYSGFTLITTNETSNYLVVETKADLDRGISESTTEVSIKGPKDCFVENYQKNIGLIRRRIKHKTLLLKEVKIGKYTNTLVGVMYISSIADKENVDKILKKISNINTDAILDSNYIKELLISKNNAYFPKILSTEKPDLICSSLLEGKICIVVENSPNVLILPTFFIDFFHSPDDYYQKNVNVSITRIIRFISFFIAIITPALYIAMTTHNHELIPIKLLINFQAQRDGVIFPALLEALFMIFTFEIIKESDTRLPSQIGSSMSIVGALVLGDAAVKAGLVSPIMIIVIAFSSISSLVFSDLDMINSIRIERIIFMIAATIFGVFGIILSLIFFIVRLSSITSLNIPYLFPFAPFYISDQKDAIIRSNRKSILKRNSILAKKNIKRQEANDEGI